MAALGVAGFGMAQFQGYAGRSVIFGLIGIGVPIVTAIFMGGSVFFFYALPIIGLYYGVRALTRGLVLGGAVGITLNVIAGLISLIIASSH